MKYTPDDVANIKAAQDHDEQTRADERRKVLDNICYNCAGMADGGEQCKTCYVKSLRAEQEQAGER